MEKMKYSFVLPAYKARFFKEAIDSILAQTYTHFELIIVNDASPEDLDAIVADYNDPRIRYYKNEENIGGKDLVAQWNHCITYATGEYLILASDDDVYHPLYLEKMNALVDKYPDVNVFRPRIQYVDENGKIVRVWGVLNEYTSLLEFIYDRGNVGIGIPYYIFNRASLDSISGFVNYPLAWHSDDITVIKLAENGVVFCSDILFSFRCSGDSISSKQNNSWVLRQKVMATNLFYDDFSDLLLEIEPKSYMDEFYRSKVYSSILYDKRNNLKIWFNSSSKIAVLKCFFLYWKCKEITVGMILNMYIRRLFLI